MTFTFEEERPSDSPLIEKIWRKQTGLAGAFISTAESHSEIVIGRYAGKTTVTVRGPETKVSLADIPAEGEFMGIVFRLGTFMPGLLPNKLADRRDANLSLAGDASFWLDGAAWEIPNFENADTFVARLARRELLVHDPVVGAVLRGEPQAFAPRTLQYRFMRATGLPYKLIQQIQRAQQASALLQSGASIIETAYAAGYFDQSHLTNALKRFLGQTPAQIARLNDADYLPEYLPEYQQDSA